MSTSVRREAQLLDTDPMVELWELDTSRLLTILGIAGQGSVYRWTPGVLDYRIEGVLGAGSTAQVLVLDRVITIPNPAIVYTASVSSDALQHTFSPPIRVTGIATQTVGASTVSVVSLFSAMTMAPVAGSRYLLASNGSCFMGGVEYKPAPIELTNMEWSGRGALPRPTLRVSNLGGLAAALVIEFGDIVGATVTRRITFKKFLDGEASPDPSAAFEPEIFVVDRKSHHDKSYIEFELASVLDQQGIQLPRRIIMRDHCDHTYRAYTALGTGFFRFVQGTCPYAGAAMFKIDGSVTFDPALDVCGKKLSDCLLRFGETPLPFQGFPGVAEVPT